MAQLLRSLQRLGNSGAIDNAAFEVDRSQVENLIIQALTDRVQPDGGAPDGSPEPGTRAA